MESADHWETFQQLRRDLCAVHYAAASARAGDPLAGGPGVKRGYLLRDSMIYRLEAVAFHADLIVQRQGALERVAYPIERRSVDFVRTASRDEKFLLDDVVFSIVSLFDYFGSWCDFLYNVELKALRGFKLLRVSAAPPESGQDRYEPTNNRLRDSSVVELAARENSTWLKGLTEYRGALIHGRADEAKGSLSFTFRSRGVGEPSDLSVDASILAPDSLVKRVSFLASNPGHNVTVSHAAERLNDQATEALRRLLHGVIDDFDVASNPNVSTMLKERGGPATLEGGAI